MRLKPNRTPLVLLLLLPLFIQAQSSLPKTLLWRITPPGGGRPSWLCGTIHVQDRRVFSFPDSLYDAIGRADAFAMELDPDTLVQTIFSQLNGGKEKSVRSNAPTVPGKSGKTSRKYRQPKAKDDDMPTIVDLYLSGIAKDMGKPVTGLEKFADQSSLVDDLEENFDKGRSSGGNNTVSALEKMIKVYADGDLQGVYDLTLTFDPMEMDKLLVQRNRKMAIRMDSLMSTKNYFFAVGAAHLPGPEGLIEAMRRRGFTVEPVLSSKRMPPDHYVFRNRAQWKTYDDPYQGWVVDLPGKPFPVNTGKGVDMTGYMDLGDLRMYFLTGMAMGGDLDLLGRDSMIIGELKKNYAKNSAIQIDSVRQLVANDSLHTWEMTGSEASSGYKVRMRIVFQGGRMFLVFLGTRHQQELFDARSEKYLSSFHTLPTVNGFSIYTDSATGFSVLMPGPTRKIQTEHDSTISAWQYTCAATVDGMAANVIVVTTAPNFVITSDSSYFRRSAQNLMDNDFELVRQADTVVSGQNGMIMVFRSGSGAFINHMLSLKRGGRIYTLLSTEDRDKPSPAARQRYLSSLRLLMPGNAGWDQQTLPGTELRVFGPSTFTLRAPEDEAPHGASFLAYDEATSISYSIYLDTLNRFLWSDNDSLLLDHYISPYHFNGQVELERRYFRTSTDARCMSLTTTVEDSRQVKRVQICLQGDRLMTATAYVPEEWEHHLNVDGFFAYAIPPKAEDAHVMETREPGMIFRALRSADPDVRDTAYDAMETLRFPASMSATMLDEIMKGFPEDSANAGRIETKLLSEISDLADSSTLPLIRDRWSRFSKDQEHLRYQLLNIVSGLKTEEAFRSLPLMLKEHLPAKPDAYAFVRDLVDTVSLAKGIWKDLLPFSGDSLLGPELFRLHKALLDSGLLSLEEFRRQFPRMQGALESYDRELAREVFAPFSAHGKAIFDLLGKLNDASSRTWLRRYLASSSSGGRMNAALQLLKLDQTVDPKVWAGVAKDKETRLDLYDELKELDRLKLFPREFQTRRSFAESHAWLLSEDDHSPKSIHFLREVTTAFKGSNRTFLLFRVTLEDEEGDYNVLAIVGPYAPGTKDLLPPEEDDVSGIYEDDEYTPGLEMRQFAAYLKSFEESR